MNFNEYQKKARTTRIHKNTESGMLLLARLTLGLLGESGEVAEKVKKFIRDTDGRREAKINLKEILKKELGDVLWYLANVADVLKIDLNFIAKENIKKLASRKKRNKLTGSGDNR